MPVAASQVPAQLPATAEPAASNRTATHDTRSLLAAAAAVVHLASHSEKEIKQLQGWKAIVENLMEL